MIILLFSMNKSQISNNLGHKIKVEKCQFFYFLYEDQKQHRHRDMYQSFWKKYDHRPSNTPYFYSTCGTEQKRAIFGL